MNYFRYRISKYSFGVLLFIGILHIIFQILWDTSLIYPNVSPALLGFTRSVVLTPSMNPTIPPGSFIITKEMENYFNGDIVLYRPPDKNYYVLHRVISVSEQEELFTLKGDSNTNPDSPPVPKEAIIGKCIFSNRTLGTLVLNPILLGFIYTISLYITYYTYRKSERMLLDDSKNTTYT